MSEKEQNLTFFLEKLEESSDKIIATQGYNKDAERLKTLEEIIKEQVVYANSGSAARPTR